MFKEEKEVISPLRIVYEGIPSHDWTIDKLGKCGYTKDDSEKILSTWMQKKGF